MATNDTTAVKSMNSASEPSSTVASAPVGWVSWRARSGCDTVRVHNDGQLGGGPRGKIFAIRRSNASCPGPLFEQENRKIWAQKVTFSDHTLGELSRDRLQGQFARTTPSMYGPVSERTDVQPHDCIGAVNSRFAQFRSVLARMPRQRVAATIGSTRLRSAACRWPGAGKQPREFASANFAICAIFPLVSEMVQHQYSLPIEKTSGHPKLAE
ncbi:hypothetical protein B0H19DRAFT_1083491 [Mycena capillaripes]|nr:hypothetical protein B0H19DRAFT_1083491 [Mycena capillaripes]